jgi:hypothetical protein
MKRKDRMTSAQVSPRMRPMRATAYAAGSAKIMTIKVETPTVTRLLKMARSNWKRSKIST